MHLEWGHEYTTTRESVEPEPASPAAGGGRERSSGGKVGTGILMIVTLGAFGIWALIDFIMILVGSFKDKEERVLSNW